VFSGGVYGFRFFQLISNTGNTYVYNCTPSITSPPLEQYIMYPCRPESADYGFRNISEWVVMLLGQSHYSYKGNLSTSVVDIPKVQLLNFGDLNFEAGMNSPKIFQFTTSVITNSIYFFFKLGSPVYIRISKFQCDGIITAVTATSYYENTISFDPSTTYFLYIAPTSRDNLIISQMIYPGSLKCSANCDTDGGVCYDDKCTCKQGHYGAQCELVSCDSAAPLPCHCTILKEITPEGTHLSTPGDGPNYFSFKKPSMAGNGQGWLVKLDPVQYWTDFYFNKVDSKAENFCPRSETLIDIRRTTERIIDTNFIYKMGFRPCSPELDKYTNTTEFVFRVAGAIDCAATVVDLPPLAMNKIKIGNTMQNTIGFWTPVLYELDVPSSVTNATLTYFFDTNMEPMNYYVHIMLQPCQYANATSSDLPVYKEFIIVALKPGVKNYLVFEGDDSVNHQPYPFSFAITV